MLSFKSIALLGAVAFGAFSTAFAAPTVAEVATRDVAVRGVAAIVADVTANIQVHIDALHHCTKDNATVAVLTPIVVGIKTAISAGVSECHGLIGQPKEVILAVAGVVGVDVKVGALLDVSAVAKIVADLLILVCGAISAVLAVVDVTVVVAVQILLCSLLEVVGALVAVILQLVVSLLPGLVAAIYALIGDVIHVLVSLNVTVILSLFSIPCGCN